MAHDMAVYFMRCLLVVGICWLVGATRCTTVPIKEEVVRQQFENTGAKETAAKYIPEGLDRDRVFNALDNSSELMGRQDQKLTKETKRADENEDAADFLFWLKWGGGILTIGLIALYLKSR